MKLEHIALTVIHQNEIEGFYVNILGMKVVKSFVLSAELANSIFKINQEILVFHLKKGNLLFEIFIGNFNISYGFNHICISVTDKASFIKNAISRNYKPLIVKRDYGDIVFVSDNIGNLFEIKEKTQN